MFTTVSYCVAWCHLKPKSNVCAEGDWGHAAAEALWSRYDEPQMLSIEIKDFTFALLDFGFVLIRLFLLMS